MAVSAAAVVNKHWVVCCMAGCDTGWGVENDPESSGRVINRTMGCAVAFVLMTIKTVDSACAVV